MSARLKVGMRVRLIADPNNPKGSGIKAGHEGTITALRDFAGPKGRAKPGRVSVMFDGVDARNTHQGHNLERGDFSVPREYLRPALPSDFQKFMARVQSPVILVAPPQVRRQREVAQ